MVAKVGLGRRGEVVSGSVQAVITPQELVRRVSGESGLTDAEFTRCTSCTDSMLQALIVSELEAATILYG